MARNSLRFRCSIVRRLIGEDEKGMHTRTGCVIWSPFVWVRAWNVGSRPTLLFISARLILHERHNKLYEILLII